MNDNEMKHAAIERFVNIQRIKKYGEKEIDYQDRIARAELKSLGISTGSLELKD